MKVQTKGNGEPEITVVGSIHGDEPAGKKAIERILEENLEYKRPVKFITANEKAVEKGERYLDADLNRSFPGDKQSSLHEERLAAQILEEIGDSTVLDIHTTRSHPEPFATLKDTDEKTVELVSSTNVEKAVYFPNDSGTMTGYVDGVIVETGYQESEKAVKNAVKIIKNFLAYHGAIDREYETSEPDIYRYTETVDGDWRFKAENFEKVEKGEVYAVKDGEKLEAEEDFYPVLMSTNGYDGQLGYKAEKIEVE